MFNLLKKWSIITLIPKDDIARLCNWDLIKHLKEDILAKFAPFKGTTACALVNTTTQVRQGVPDRNLICLKRSEPCDQIKRQTEESRQLEIKRSKRDPA